MTKYLIDLWLDGYETEEEREPAQREWIEEQLNFTASSVKLLDLTQLEADAKLGRLVRKLPLGSYLYHSRADVWQVYETNPDTVGQHGDRWLAPYEDDIVKALEAALAAAGIKDE